MIESSSMRFICLLCILYLAVLKTSNAQSLPPSPGRPRPPTNAAGAPIKALCKRIRVLTVLNKTANDPAVLSSLVASGRIKETQLAFVKSSAASINAQLTDLTTNVTLKAECNVINASRKTTRQCRRLKKLERVVNLASNNTADAARLIGEILKTKDKEGLNKTIAEARVQLEQLKSNNTLTRLCETKAGSSQEEEQSSLIGNREC